MKSSKMKYLIYRIGFSVVGFILGILIIPLVPFYMAEMIYCDYDGDEVEE